MKTSKWPVVAGAALGIVASLLTYNGNPGNMGFCAACFLRDSAGSIGLHQIPTLQYIRPELIGLILGALISALFNKEFRPRIGPSPLIRLGFGFFAMLGALIFLGCPWRGFLRLGGGDLSAISGILGLISGIYASLWFINRGYSLGKSSQQSKFWGFVPSIISIGLLAGLITKFSITENLPLYFSTKGPASQHANLWLSLAAGLLLGILMQKSRFCTIGAFRNLVLSKDLSLFYGIIALLLSTLFTNIMLDQFNLSWDKQPLAHNQYIWNFLAMALCGLCFSLGGGCPGKQLVHLGEGDNNSSIFIIGMLLGAGAAHRLSIAASGAGINQYSPYAILLGFIFCIYIGITKKSV